MSESRMTIEERNVSMLEKTPTSVPTQARNVLIAGIALGVAGFAWGFSAHDSIMWAVLLVNFMLLAGLTIGGPIAAAVMSIVIARWGRPVKRFAELTIFYTPFLFVLLGLLYLGADNIWEWTLPHDEVHLHGAKGVWLSKNFVFARVVVYLIVLMGMGLYYVKKSARPDAGLAQELDASWNEKHPASQAITSGFSTVEEEAEKTRSNFVLYGPWFVAAYAVFFAMIGYDFVMSIDPHWFSTMFGGWMFMQNMAATMAFLGIVTFTAKHRLGLESIIQYQQHHDIGKLTFGSSIFWAYLGFAQFIVIWYGNLPEETMFLMDRSHGEWQWVFFTVIGMCWFIPFNVLMPRAHKVNPTIYRSNGIDHIEWNMVELLYVDCTFCFEAVSSSWS